MGILSSTCTTAQTTAGPTWSQLIRSSPPWISPHTQVGAQDGSGKLLPPQPWYKLLVEKELQAPLSISFKSLARSQRFIARDLLRSFISTKELLSPSPGWHIEDMDFSSNDELVKLYPQHEDIIKEFDV